MSDFFQKNGPHFRRFGVLKKAVAQINGIARSGVGGTGATQPCALDHFYAGQLAKVFAEKFGLEGMKGGLTGVSTKDIGKESLEIIFACEAGEVGGNRLEGLLQLGHQD